MKLHNRSVALAPATFDENERTIEAVISTGADVVRAGYVERLPIANADLRGIEGKPVLDAHNQGSTRAVLGVITKAWKRDGEIRALIKLSSRDDVAGIVRDVADGIIRNLSIGYRVTRWADSTNSKGERIRTALAWTIHEASFVPIGADAGAVTRSNPDMKKKPVAGAPASEQDETPEGETVETTVAQTRAEIRDIARRAGQPATWADEHIDNGATVEAVRAAAFEAMQERTRNFPRVRVVSDHSDPAQIMQRQIGGLHARATGAKPADNEREFAALTLSEHADAILRRHGISTVGLTREDRMTRAIGTGDLPELLTGVGNRSLLAAYQVASSPLLQLAKKSSLTDFRPASRLRAGELGSLEPLGEHGEIQHTSRTESKQAIQLETFGRRIDYTMKAIINDDLGALTDATQAFGIAAAARDADELVAALLANPTMDDGFALFSADHDNVNAAGGTISVHAMNDVRVAMRATVGDDGETLLNITPKYLLVPAGMETTAEMFLSEFQPVDQSDVNPFKSKLTLIVEPRLPDYDWYVFADPALAPVLEMARLAGREGPQVESQQAWDTWGVSFRCIHHVGAAAIGWRGAYRVPNDDSNSLGGA